MGGCAKNIFTSVLVFSAQIADNEVSALQKDMEELESVRKTLAEFFCEDMNTFKLEECFKVFHGFCVKFKQAIAENERRRIQEEQAAARRKQREEQLAAKRRNCTWETFILMIFFQFFFFSGFSCLIYFFKLLVGQQGSNGSESECNIVDTLLSDIRSGFSQKGCESMKVHLKFLRNTF